ncbi:MAG TPA: dihydrolipoamide acetyltransferase family protein [Candidatus Limnocylindria bacterium]|nr:dihydrolipoamide acetyltransferase family protein [Candidatus Limnocylindria bacterium]
MPFELKMPKLGESVTEGTIGKWLKQPGEQVKKYDLLVEVQTDKVNTEIPSEVDGTLSEIKVQEGQTVSVGTVLAVLETGAAAAEAKPAAQQAQPAEAKAAAPAEAKAAAPAAAAAAGGGKATASPAAAEAPAPTASPKQQAPAQTAAVQTAPVDTGSGNGKAAPPRPEVRATPAVRKLAAEHGIDIAQIEGTGLGGRVSRQDVEQFVASRGQAPQAGGQAASQGRAPAAAQAQAPRPAPLAGDTPVPLTQMRRAIATNMVQAWSAPHAHAVMEIDMTNLMRFRDTVKGDFQKREGFDLSPAAFIVKAAVEALSQVQAVNSSWTDQGVVLRKAINIGYAVALGEDGLVVPVIKSADEKSITGLMRAIRDVVDRAKAKKLTLDDFQGATFTVNNTGPLGTFVSSPIVPPGQAAIISSESIRKRLVVMDDDSIAIRQMMNLVIGFDHRAIDGSTAAKFLMTMRDWLQGINEAVPIS